MGEWRASTKIVIVASAVTNTTATRNGPVPQRKKQPATPKAAVTPSRKRKTAADANAPVNQKRPRSAPPAVRPNGAGKHDLVIVDSPPKPTPINTLLGTN